MDVPEFVDVKKEMDHLYCSNEPKVFVKNENASSPEILETMFKIEVDEDSDLPVHDALLSNDIPIDEEDEFIVEDTRVKQVKRNQKATNLQVVTLLNFMEENRAMILNKGNHPVNTQYVNKLWMKAAKILNHAPRGSKKTTNEWRRFYCHFKSKAKRRLRIKRHESGNKYQDYLNENELKLLTLLGECPDIPSTTESEKSADSTPISASRTSLAGPTTDQAPISQNTNAPHLLISNNGIGKLPETMAPTIIRIKPVEASRVDIRRVASHHRKVNPEGMNTNGYKEPAVKKGNTENIHLLINDLASCIRDDVASRKEHSAALLKLAESQTKLAGQLEELIRIQLTKP